MDYRYRMSQEDLKYIYDTGNKRSSYHTDVAERYHKIVGKCDSFKTEKEALEYAIKLEKENPYTHQIWAGIELSDNIYRIKNYWIVIDDNKVKLAADYIGMALMYDETRLQIIIDSKVDIDEVIAYC